jgi:hypothetical protein
VAQPTDGRERFRASSGAARRLQRLLVPAEQLPRVSQVHERGQVPSKLVLMIRHLVASSVHLMMPYNRSCRL